MSIDDARSSHLCQTSTLEPISIGVRCISCCMCLCLPLALDALDSLDRMGVVSVARSRCRCCLYCHCRRPPLIKKYLNLLFEEHMNPDAPASLPASV